MQRGDLLQTEGNNKLHKSALLVDNTQNILKMVQGLPVMIYRCFVDPDWAVDFINDGAFSLTGYQPSQLLEDKDFFFNKIIHPEDRDRIWNQVQTSAIPGTFFKFEYRIETAQGEEKWVWDQGHCIKNPVGRKVLEGLIIDISQYKRAEQEMAYLSFHDKLTNLYNRRFFEEELRRVDTPRQLPLSLVLADVNGLKLINDVFGHQQGDDFLCSTAELLRLSCRKEDIVSRWGGDEFIILMPQTRHEAAQSLCSRIKQSATSFSHRFLNLAVAVGCATKEHSGQNIMDIFNEAESNMYKDKILESRNSRGLVLDSLKQEVLQKEFISQTRAANLKQLVLGLGQALGLKGPQLEELSVLTTVCNMGKLSIDEAIFKKPHKLNPSEWALIHKHPEMGYRIARTFPELAPLADAILSHHERWDGKGYPQGLRGLQIPLFSRILSIAQAYDAMTNPRPYARTLKPAHALAEIQWCAGSQFDPKMAEMFVGLMRRGNLSRSV